MTAPTRQSDRALCPAWCDGEHLREPVDMDNVVFHTGPRSTPPLTADEQRELPLHLWSCDMPGEPPETRIYLERRVGLDAAMSVDEAHTPATRLLYLVALARRQIT